MSYDKFGKCGPIFTFLHMLCALVKTFMSPEMRCFTIFWNIRFKNTTYWILIRLLGS